MEVLVLKTQVGVALYAPAITYKHLFWILASFTAKPTGLKLFVRAQRDFEVDLKEWYKFYLNLRI